MRVTLKAFEAFLKETGTPYVAVDEAKRALFAGVKLRAFDFVVYSATGPNILATCKPFSAPGMADTMREWEGVFGQGFAAAEVRHRGGRWVYVALDGTERDAEGQGAQIAQFDPPPEEPGPAVGGQLLLVETRLQPSLFDTGRE